MQRTTTSILGKRFSLLSKNTTYGPVIFKWGGTSDVSESTKTFSNTIINLPSLSLLLYFYFEVLIKEPQRILIQTY